MSSSLLQGSSMLEHWRHYLKDITSSDDYINMSFYFLIASALQRRVWIGAADFPIFPNLYMILVGGPGVGKSMAIDPVARALKWHKTAKFGTSGVAEQMRSQFDAANNAAGKKEQYKVSDFLIPVAPDNITYEDLVKTQSIAISYMRGVEKTPLSPKGLYAHASLVFCLDELSNLFGKHADKVLKYLLTAYNCRDYTYSTLSRGTDTVRNMCLSLLAGTTFSFMQDMLETQMINDGFASRVLFVVANKPRFFRFEIPSLTKEQQDSYNFVLQRIKKLSTFFGQVTYTPEAKEFLRIYFEEILPYTKSNKSKLLETYYARKNLHIQKLALALHFADNDTFVIQEQTCANALSILNYLEKDMDLALSHDGSKQKSITYEMVENFFARTQSAEFDTIWAGCGSAKRVEVIEVLTQMLAQKKLIINGKKYERVEA